MKNTKNEMKFKYVMYSIFIILAIISLFPFFIVMVNTTRSTTQIQQSISLLPSRFFLLNFRILQDFPNFNIIRGFLNSLTISTGTTILAIYFSALTAFGIKNYEFKYKNLFFTFLIAIILVPPQLSLIGFYNFMLRIGLTDSRIALILPAISSPVTVFFLKQYLDAIFQKDLIDAARIDGVSELYIFHRIMLPIMRPGLATMAIFVFVGSWNNLITPMMLITSTDKYTLPMLVQLLTTDLYRPELGSTYLGAALSITPLLVVYCLLAKNIISGLSLGSVKG